ncbi:Glucose-methanol-choline (GMC) oxidoreductase:NAD binding site [hydrothermal vent metagenome]|uniref:Glucose-methanol-choline (GMC) oxidoreductase:NAD binding site n=1 Tax=hydrothermal vent metagenome TaxID=652676 RepID=A0A3B0U3D2_9ZZZZ
MCASPDILIVGSGMGGATLAAALAPSGCQIIILERGEQLKDTPQARDEIAIFRDGVFRPDEQWLDAKGTPFNPGNYYYVGGNSKFYGAVMLRYRAEDFGELAHLGGVSPAWPFPYETLEPWYQAAEEMFKVRGNASDDLSEPFHSGAYPFPPVPDEPTISLLRHRLVRAGVVPSALPLAIDIEKWLKRAKTPWDAFPDTTGAKNDAQTTSLARALEFANVKLETGARVVRLNADKAGRINSVDYVQNETKKRLSPKLVALAAGAVNSAALLLKSASEQFPNGLANRSDMVGRNFMNHNSSALIAIDPWRKNTAIYQKTLQFNDFYLKGGPKDMPLGNVQLLGKISGTILACQSGLPGFGANWIAGHGVDFYAMSEDLPNPESRVKLVNDVITLDWKRSNWDTHLALVAKVKSVLHKARFPIVLSKAFDRNTPSHQCGTARFGADPANSVLDIYCRAHDHKNLFVVDASFLPNSAAVNPALTIAAQALRVGAHIIEKDLAA